jgi:hypothetical protein
MLFLVITIHVEITYSYDTFALVSQESLYIELAHMSLGFLLCLFLVNETLAFFPPLLYAHHRPVRCAKSLTK